MRVLHRKLRHVAVVTLKSGLSFRGLLYTYDRRAFLFRDCQVLEEGGDRRPVPVDGELLVLAADIDYVQFP